MPLPAKPEPVVTLVAPATVDDFLNARNGAERLRHLRELRDRGVLIHDRGRLQQTVRGQGIRRAYVFRAPADRVPRAAARAREQPPTGRVLGVIEVRRRAGPLTAGA